MPLNEPKLLVRFPDLNRETQNIERYSLEMSFMSPADTFSFTLYEPELSLMRNLELQPVELYVDGNLQLKGRIEVTEVGNRANGLAIVCQGRDYISNLMECSVDPALGLTDKMSLTEAVKRAARPAGVDKVSLSPAAWRNKRAGAIVQTPKVQTKIPEAALKQYKPNPGENIYDFLTRLAVRFGVTLQPTHDTATLLLSSPDYQQEASYAVLRSIANPNSNTNNELFAVAKRDYTHFPTVVLVTGRAGGSGQTRTPMAATSWYPPYLQDYDPEKGWVLLPRLAGYSNEYKQFIDELNKKEELQPGANKALKPQQKTPDELPTEATSVPNNLRQKILKMLPPGVMAFTQRILPTVQQRPLGMYRLVYLRDTLSKDIDQLSNTTARVTSERLKDCLQYEVTLRGHKDIYTNRTYTYDTIIEVADEICGVYEKLWVEKCMFSYDAQQGPYTVLTCWRPESFQIMAKD